MHAKHEPRKTIGYCLEKNRLYCSPTPRWRRYFFQPIRGQIENSRWQCQRKWGHVGKKPTSLNRGLGLASQISIATNYLKNSRWQHPGLYKKMASLVQTVPGAGKNPAKPRTECTGPRFPGKQQRWMQERGMRNNNLLPTRCKGLGLVLPFSLSLSDMNQSDMQSIQ